MAAIFLCLRIAIHSRFTSVLGDFVDTVTPIWSQEKQLKAFSALMKNINLIKEKSKTLSLYVFSDSVIYLEYMKENTNFKFLEGEPLHPDNKKGLDYNLEEHAKTFIDFFALAESAEIVMVRLPNMYSSAYPKYASCLNNIPFKEVVIKS